MTSGFACIAGEEIYRLWDAGKVAGEALGPRQTPFGASGEVFLVDRDRHPFYLLARHRKGLAKTAPHVVNHRANVYALRDLGVDTVMGWGPAGAITHSIMLNDLVLISDLIDFTFLRDRTFFEGSPLGYLRQFPVFCGDLRKLAIDVLHAMGLVYHPQAIAAVKEGPRLETPAEVRHLAGIGAEIVTHCLVPEVFLARELQMCYAGVCYVVNYAETGSRHRPFETGGLFGNLQHFAHGRHIDSPNASLDQVARLLAGELATRQKTCECPAAMDAMIDEFHLDRDWRKWFQQPS